jgi:hypothetical protein
MRNIISIIFVIAALAIFGLFINPRYAAIRALRAEAQSFDSALERSKELIGIRDALLSRYNAFPSENIARLNTLLPNSIDTVRLIIDINTLASKYGMSLSAINIGVPDEAAGNSNALGPSGKDFGVLTLSFNVTTSYDRFRALLSDLEQSLRLIDVTSVDFTAPTQGVGLTIYSVTVATYWLK